MSNSTHVNSFKADVAEAIAKAHAVIGDLEQTVERLVAKLEGDVAPVAVEVPAETVKVPVTESK